MQSRHMDPHLIEMILLYYEACSPTCQAYHDSTPLPQIFLNNSNVSHRQLGCQIIANDLAVNIGMYITKSTANCSQHGNWHLQEANCKANTNFVTFMIHMHVCQGTGCRDGGGGDGGCGPHRSHPFQKGEEPHGTMGAMGRDGMGQTTLNNFFMSHDI